MTGSEVIEGSGGDQGEGNENKPAGDERAQRDFWDYMTILARPISAFLTAVAVALIGWFGQMYLSEQAKQLTIRSENEQNIRLRTELMTRREDAESALRKDMFEAILTEFFKGTGSDSGAGDTSKRLLKLELLALNFSESLSLSPLFLELANDIETLGEKPGQSGYWRLERDQHRARLRSLARRVSGRQLSSLSIGGELFDFYVPTDKVATKDGYRWPDEYVEDEWRGQERALLEEGENKDDWIAQTKHDLSTYELGGVWRQYTATFKNPNMERKSVDVRVEIQEVSENGDPIEVRATEMRFQLNFFNFPMIDNTRLSKDQRFALVIESFDTQEIRIAGICFPGIYASQRDKPTLDEAIEQLPRSKETGNSKGEKSGS